MKEHPKFLIKRYGDNAQQAMRYVENFLIGETKRPHRTSPMYRALLSAVIRIREDDVPGIIAGMMFAQKSVGEKLDYCITTQVGSKRHWEKEQPLSIYMSCAWTPFYKAKGILPADFRTLGGELLAYTETGTRSSLELYAGFYLMVMLCTLKWFCENGQLREPPTNKDGKFVYYFTLPDEDGLSELTLDWSAIRDHLQALSSEAVKEATNEET